MKAFLLSLLLPLVAGAQDVALPFFAADTTALTIDLCSSNLIYSETGGGSADSWASGDFFAQKIKNTSETPVTVKFVTMYAYHNGGTVGSAQFTCYVRSTNTIAGGTTYGSPSVTTNTIRSPNWIDLHWTPGTEPVVPAGEDFWVGVTCTLNSETVNINAIWVNDGSTYRDQNYYATKNGVYYFSAPNYDLPMDIYACFYWAIPEELYITMDFNSANVPQGRMKYWPSDLWWKDQIRVTGTTTNDYMYNTRDGVIMSSGVMGNNGAATATADIVTTPAEMSLGSNWSWWMTVKREDWQTTVFTAMKSGAGEILGDSGWEHFWNLASPSYLARTTNHTVSEWSDILITLTNNTTYAAYLNGTFMTNQPKSGSSPIFKNLGLAYGGWPGMEKIGRILIWNGAILTQTNATRLHEYMLTNNLNIASVSNALPFTSGLRNAWRTAGYRGRIGTWTDYISGGTWTPNYNYLTLSDAQRAFVVTGRGIRNWGLQDGTLSQNALLGSFTIPANYTLCITFTPKTSGYAETGYLLYGGLGGYITYKGSTAKLETLNVGAVSPALAENQTHTVMVVRTNSASTYYVDGQWTTNTAQGFSNETIGGLGTLFQLGSPFWNGQFAGYIGEVLLYTNAIYSTNDAVSYYTYATNQYGYDWAGVTNSPTNTVAGTENPYGYRFTPCASSNLWSSPILQQQTNENNYGNSTSWIHQKIHNTNSTEVRIRSIKIKCDATPGGGNTRAICYVAKTNYNSYIGGVVGTPFPDMTYGISTNCCILNAAAQWYTWDFDDAQTPIIPPNQDFYIIAQPLDNYISWKYYYGTDANNKYEGYNYDHSHSSTGDGSWGDLMFEIFICP